MKATEILKKEHKNILKVITALRKECNAIEDKKKKFNKIFFIKVIDFIRNYADKFHHAKEEDILFKELKKEEIQLHCDPIQQMLYEHEQGRSFVKGMFEAVQENNKDKAIHNAREYIFLLEEHINKEDNVLYPMADDVLPKKDQDYILKEFKKVKEKYKGKIDKYLDFVKSLE